MMQASRARRKRILQTRKPGHFGLRAIVLSVAVALVCSVFAHRPGFAATADSVVELPGGIILSYCVSHATGNPDRPGPAEECPMCVLSGMAMLPGCERTLVGSEETDGFLTIPPNRMPLPHQHGAALWSRGPPAIS